MPEEDMCLYHVLQVQNALQNTCCSVEHQQAALGDSCFPWGPLEAAAGVGWRGGLPHMMGDPVAAGTVALVRSAVCARLPSSPDPLKCRQPR